MEDDGKKASGGGRHGISACPVKYQTVSVFLCFQKFDFKLGLYCQPVPVFLDVGLLSDNFVFGFMG